CTRSTCSSASGSCCSCSGGRGRGRSRPTTTARSRSPASTGTSSTSSGSSSSRCCISSAGAGTDGCTHSSKARLLHDFCNPDVLHVSHRADCIFRPWPAERHRRARHCCLQGDNSHPLLHAREIQHPPDVGRRPRQHLLVRNFGCADLGGLPDPIVEDVRVRIRLGARRRRRMMPLHRPTRGGSPCFALVSRPQPLPCISPLRSGSPAWLPHR